MMNTTLRNGARIGLLLLLAGIGPATAQQARWLETHSWSGTGTAQTPLFWINADKWRVRYRPRGTGIFRIEVFGAAGEQLAVPVHHAFPVRGRRTLRNRGHMYLAVTGLETEWTVAIEQYVSVIEEWHLLRQLSQPRRQPTQLGTWTGAEGEETVEFTVPSDRWKVVHSNAGDGFLQVVIRDAANHAIVAANTAKAGSETAWGHQAGTYTMNITAVNTTWSVDVVFWEPEAAAVPGNAP